MTDHSTRPPATPVSGAVGQGLADTLLADIAIRVQLSPTAHCLATERYQALDHWIRREASPLHGLVETTYAQGSMRIGTTINSHFTNDEFDIDAVTQLALAITTPPNQVLDILFNAVRGEPGSRYFGCTRRRSRCVTVSYKGGMHVDLTPAILQVGKPPRQSWMFEHESRRQFDLGTKLIANPYGFAEWFKQQLPDDNEFSRWYRDRAQTYEERILGAEPVPPPEPVDQKSRVVVALQLLKRCRNVQYAERPGRRPPSVVLSKLAADTAAAVERTGPGLVHVLLHVARTMLAALEHAQMGKRLIHVENPVCPADILTDRWPRTLDAQMTFIADLRNLVADLQALQRSSDIDEIEGILIRLFGEAPARQVVEPHRKAIPQGPVRVTTVGGVSVGGTAAATHAAGRTVLPHTFHGDGDDGL